MKIGIQQYSCLDKTMTGEGLFSALEVLAKMGYHGVEFVSLGGYEDVEPEKLKKHMEKLDLVPINIHVHMPFENWMDDKALEEVLSRAKRAGLSMITLPYLQEKDRSPERFQTILKTIPHWIEKCREWDMEFCYHNHHFEMDQWGDGILLEAIAEAAPDMKIELDTFWTEFAGKEPCEMMESFGKKLRLVHIKDYEELSSFEEMKFTAIGTGKMDNAAIVRKAEEMGQPWIIVEQDNSPIDTLDSAVISIQNLRKIVGET